MDASLRLNVAIKGDNGVSILVNRLDAVFFVEWRLVVESSCQSQSEAIVALRHVANAETWRYERLLVEIPIAVAHTHIEGKGTSS